MKTWRVITYVFLALCLAGGILISFSCFGYHRVDLEEELPTYVPFGSILGPYLIMVPILLLSYIVYGPFESKRPLALKIITPFITAFLLAGIVFLVVLVIPKDPTSVEPEDYEGIWLMTITSAVCCFIVSLIFIIFGRLEASPLKYLITLFISIVVSFLIVLLVFLIRYFATSIVSAIATGLLIYIIVKAFGNIEVSEEKYTVNENGTERELTQTTSSEYIDDRGDTWISDDGGQTAHRKD